MSEHKDVVPNARTEFRLTDKGSGITFWMFLIIGLLLAALGVFVLAAGGASTLPKALAGAIPILIGAGIAYSGYWWRNRALNDREPRLVIDSAGIHAPKVAAKPIPWASIEKIVMFKSRFEQSKGRHKPGYLAIDVDDPKAYSPTTLNRMLSGANSLLAGGEFIVYTDSLDGDYDAIKAALVNSHPSLTLQEK